LRYEEYKTYEEIIEALEKKSISSSMGELTNLTRTFEYLIKGWHEQHVQEIKKKLGDYILSIDGTYSYKDKTLYIFHSYENGVVLFANTTEKNDKSNFQPLLEKVV
jgi:Ni,Fe-hydrogenase I small subunit